jgi:hypothetical protein
MVPHPDRGVWLFRTVLLLAGVQLCVSQTAELELDDWSSYASHGGLWQQHGRQLQNTMKDAEVSGVSAA